VDNGYYDMYKVMKALADVKYNGIVHLDHAVPMVGGDRTSAALSRSEQQGKGNDEKSYGFRTFRCLELALYQSLGKLPEPESTHKFF
jgi:D-mannonate dehydratase